MISELARKHNPVAWLAVDEAEKRGLRNSKVIQVLGDPEDDPKSGKYFAACTSIELGNLLVEALAYKEDPPRRIHV